MKSNLKRLSIEFPEEEFIYLKMACAKQGLSLKDLVTETLLQYLEEYENRIDLEDLEKELTEENIKNAIPLEKVKKDLRYNEYKKEIQSRNVTKSRKKT